MSADRVTQINGEVALTDGKKYTIKPVTLKQMKLLRPYLVKIGEWSDALPLSDPNVFDTLISACFVILQRTYPKITKEEIEELVDVKNIRLILKLAIG